MFSQQDCQLRNIQTDPVLQEQDPEMYSHQQLPVFNPFPLVPRSSFAQTKKDDDERFFQVFPAARLAAQSRNQLILNDLVQFQGSYGFCYEGSTSPSCRTDSKDFYDPTLDPYNTVVPSLQLSSSPADLQPEYPTVAHSDTLPPALSELSPALYNYSDYYYGQPSVLEPLHNEEHKSLVLEPRLLESHTRRSYSAPMPASHPPREEPIMDFLAPPEVHQSPADNVSFPHYTVPDHLEPPPAQDSPDDGGSQTRTFSPSPPSRNVKARASRGHDYKSPSQTSPSSSSRRTQTSKQQEKKGFLSCFFCRHRKIACGQPSADNPDRTCNQCLRRSLKCEYPSESRRGMRRKKPLTEDVGLLGVASPCGNSMV